MHFRARWRELQQQLPDDWQQVRLLLTVDDDAAADRAAALLAPAGPARRGNRFTFHAGRGGAGPSPEAVRRLLGRLDAEGVWGKLELLSSDTGEAPAAEARSSLLSEWDAIVATLPPDWSDVLAQIELTSSDHLEPAALELSPLNPSRSEGRPGFRFRVTRTGYGTSAAMARRCFERLDEAGLPGRLRLLRVLSDVDAVATQGPVWYAGGKVL